MRRPPDGGGRAPRYWHPGPNAYTITADHGPVILRDRADARHRIEAMDRHRRVCRELEQLASLVEYYCRPWWWAA
jgi:hypothetical protein